MVLSGESRSDLYCWARWFYKANQEVIYCYVSIIQYEPSQIKSDLVSFSFCKRPSMVKKNTFVFTVDED